MSLRAIPLPVAIYALVLSVVTTAVGLLLVASGGNLPGWFPSGLVDADGKRALLSPALYRAIGIGCLFLAAAVLLMVVADSTTSVLVGFLLVAIAVIVLLGTAVVSLWERRARSLRRTPSNAVWTAVGFVVAMALNSGLWVYLVSHR
jgi:multisubunit Na+/H+ antiporter MnhB subunit